MDDPETSYWDIVYDILSGAEKVTECKNIPQDVLMDSVYKLFYNDEFLTALTEIADDIMNGYMTIDEAAKELCHIIIRLNSRGS